MTTVSNADASADFQPSIGGASVSMASPANDAAKDGLARVPDSPAWVTLQRTFVLGLKDGLHARPASLLVRTARRFASSVTVDKGQARANARSILGLLGLAAGWGSQLRLTVTGRDAPAAMAAFERLFAANFQARATEPESSSSESDYHPLAFLRERRLPP